MSDDGIKTKVGIAGDKEYKSALSDINRQLTVLNSGMKATQSAFGSQATTMAGLKDKLSQLGGIYDQQRAKVDLIAQQLEKAKAKYGDNSKQADQLRIALNKATTQMNQTGAQISTTESELQTLAQAQEQVGEETDSANMTLKEAQDVLKQTADSEKAAGDAAKKEGDDAEKSADKNSKLGEALAKVGEVAGGAMVAGLKAAGAALAAIAAASGAALAAGFEFAQGAGQYADDMATMAIQTGVSADSLQRWAYNANFIDTPLDTITGSMSRLTSGMASAMSGNEEAAASFAALGISVTDANGRMRDNEDVFWETIDALGQISNPVERDALAMKIFGRSARELNPLIEAGSAAWREMGQEAEAMGVVFSQENLDKMGAFDDSMQRFTQTGDALKNSIGLVMIPAFQPLVDAAAISMGRVAKALQDGVSPADMPALLDGVLDDMGAALDGVLDLVTGAMPLVSQALTAAVGALAKRLPGLAKTLLPAAMGLLTSVVGAIKSNVGPITELATTLVTSLAGFLTENLPELADTALDLIGGLLDGLTAALPQLIPAGVQMIAKLAAGLIQGIPELLGRLPQIVQAIFAGFGATDWGQIGGNIVGSLISAMGTLGSGLSGLFEGAVGLIKGIDWGGVGSWIVEKVDGFLGDGGFISQAFSDAKTNIEGIDWAGLGENVAQAGSMLVNITGEALAGGLTAGYALISAIDWNGLGTTIGGIYNGLVSLTGEVAAAGFEAGHALISAIDWDGLGTTIGGVYNGLVSLTGEAIAAGFEAGHALIKAIDWDGLGTTIGGVYNGLVSLTGEAIAAGFEAGHALIKAIDWDGLGTTIGGLANALIGTTAEMLAAPFEAAHGLVKAIDWDGLGTTMGGLVNALISTTGEALAAPFELGSELIKAIDWNGIGDTIADGLNRGFGVIAGIADIGLTVGEGVVGAGQNAANWIKGFLTGNGGVDSEAGQLGSQAAADVAKGAETQKGTLKQAGIDIGGELIAGLQEKLTTETMNGIGTDAADGVSDGVEAQETTMNMAGENMATYIATGMDTETATVETAGTNLVNAAVVALNAAIGTNFISVGQNIALGIAAGILRGSGAIRAAARTAAQTAYNEAKAALDIHSPSRVMEQIGVFYDQGFASGIENGENEIRRAVDELTGAAVDEARGHVPVYNSASNTPQGVDYAAIRDAMAEAITETGAGRSVITMDGRKVGETTEAYSSRAAYNRAGRTITGRNGRMVLA